MWIFGVSVWSIHARDVLVTGSVWARTATFLLLVVVFLRAAPSVEPAPDPREIARAPVPAD